MALIKPDPDSDGDYHPKSFCNENKVLHFKEDETNALLTCPVMKIETELKIDTFKYETPVLAALLGGEVNEVKHDDQSESTAFHFIKCETEVNVNSTNAALNSNVEIENTAIKEELDPLLLTYQDMERKNEPMKKDDELELICSMRTELPNRLFKNRTGHRFQCDICKKFFSVRFTYKRHLTVHTAERPFSCDVCKKSFKTQYTLKKHVFVHTGERPFACDICKRSFTTHSNLAMHKRVHTGERPFICDKCEKSFAKGSSLKKHMRVHTGERPYKCDICKKSFNGRSNLVSHMRVHTGERPYECDRCDISFRTASNLKKHIHMHNERRLTVCNV